LTLSINNWFNKLAAPLHHSMTDMDRLLSVQSIDDIPVQYRNSPISLLLEYHNLNREFETYTSAKLLVGMCMDNRKHLHMPDNFAFIIRAGGANLRYSEFKVSFAIAVGKVQHIALIGHNNCGMVNVVGRKQEFIEGLVETAGWSKEQAEEHFMNFAPMFEIHNEIDFTLSETIRLRLRYPKIKIAPMIYRVEDNRLYIIKEKSAKDC
jgi:carbonic anhydrase